MQVSLLHSSELSNDLCCRKIKNKWKMTDEIKNKIYDMAKKDYENHIYMGNNYQEFFLEEQKKVSPDREALMRSLPSIAQKCNGRDLGLLEIICGGKRFTAKGNGCGYGNSIHYYNDEGEEVLCYTGGSGFGIHPTKAEVEYGHAMTQMYKEAYTYAKKNRGEITYNAVSDVAVDISGVVIEKNTFESKA